MLGRATHTAAELLNVPPNELKARWVCRTLDEYGLQEGEAGDRNIFVYREGFYRGTSIALLFLCLTLFARMIVPGAAIHFTKWLFRFLVCNCLPLQLSLVWLVGFSFKDTSDLPIIVSLARFFPR